MVGIALTIKSSVSHWSWDCLSTDGILLLRSSENMGIIQLCDIAVEIYW